MIYILAITSGDVVSSQSICKPAMEALFNNTTNLARIRHAMGLTAEQRLLAGFEQFELSIEVVRDGIRDQYPDADEATIQRMIVERVELMRKIQNRRSSPT